MNTQYYHSFLNRDRLVHIVDDDPGTCEALSVLFRLEGFQTTFSLQTGDFIASVERRRPDVAVVNLSVGGDSGLALLRRVKSWQSGAPVVMLANVPQLDGAVTAMKLGATDVVSKPIDSEHLHRWCATPCAATCIWAPCRAAAVPWKCAASPSSPRANARCSSSSPMANPTRRPAANWASLPAPSKSIVPG